jgi:hypothetical protein
MRPLVGGWIGAIADVITIAASLGAAWVLVVGASAQQAILALTLAVIALTSLTAVWALELQLRQRRSQEKVVGALPALAESFTYTAAAARSLADGDGARQFVREAQALCRSVASAVSTVTGQTCRVTLQELFLPSGGSPDRFAVKVVAASTSVGTGINDGIDYIDDNSDFAALIGQDDVYVNNDIVASLAGGYRNSHWTPERLEEWSGKGRYPYRSTVVWPIRAPGVAGSGDPQLDWHVIGFLSIDASEVDVFDVDTLGPLGQAAASGAYPLLSLYRTWKKDRDVASAPEER